MANEYATVNELKATLSLSGETFADADLELALEGASRAIDDATRRRFWLDDAPIERRYTPLYGGFVEIDDLAVMSTVEVDGTEWTEGTDFELTPLNAAADGRPWDGIQPIGSRVLPRRPGVVAVTGQFGWPDVPASIKQATMIVASKLFRRAREAPFGIVTVGVDQGEAMRIVTHDAQVNELVRSFRRIAVAVA